MHRQKGTVSHPYAIYIGIEAMTLFFATVAVLFRFFARRLASAWGYDDWAILAALIFSYFKFPTAVLVTTITGGGDHVNELSVAELETYLKICLSNNVLYNVSITLSKISILLLFRRIFAVRSFLIWIWLLGGLVVAYFLAAVFGLIFSYAPVEAQWKFWLPHTNINVKQFWLVMGVFNFLLDIAILVLPQFRVWRLHLSANRRRLLSVVFLFGGFVCVVSLIRISVFAKLDLNDITYNLTTPGIWTAVEANTAILCACLPTLPILFRYWFDGTKPDGSQDSNVTVVKLLSWIRTPRKGGSTDPSLEAGNRMYRLYSTEQLTEESRGSQSDLGKHDVGLHIREPVHIRKDIHVYAIDRRG